MRTRRAFQVPEQVKIEYVMLTPDALDRPGDRRRRDEVRKQYDDNVKQYAQGRRSGRRATS